MLGELYEPKGRALETARAVLECKKVYAVNISYGYCPNNCSYCYNKNNRYFSKGITIYPKKPPVELVKAQLDKGLEVEGVFMSFGCEPLISYNWEDTYDLKRLLIEHGIEVAILSKTGRRISAETGLRYGATIVSLSDEFARMYEPGATSPRLRLDRLEKHKWRDGDVWISMEPYPTPEMFKQDLHKLLEAVSFVDFIIFGKLNHDKIGNTPEAKGFYSQAAGEFVDFCESHGIRYHVKSDVLG